MTSQVIPGISHQAMRTQAPPISWLMQQALEVPGLVSLAAGLVDRPSLPVSGLGDLVAAVLADPATGQDALQYGTTQGYAPLRQQVVDRYVPDSSYADPDRVLITTGSQQFLQLVAEALLDPGDVVIVEDPTYFVFTGVLESAGVTVHGVATDAEGMVVDDCRRVLDHLRQKGLLPRLKLIYTVSYHQNPGGFTLSLARRQQLLELVAELPPGCRILEDAAYVELGFEPEQQPPLLAALDVSGRRVITALTSSKPFAPGLKTGFGILPQDLVQLLTWLKGNHDFGSGNLAQHVISRALDEGLFDAQVACLRETYGRKAAALDTALREELPEGAATWLPTAGGLYLWLDLCGLPTGPDSAFFQACLEEQVLYVPGSFAFCPERGRPKPDDQLRLTYGVADEQQLVEGARRLARAWRRVAGSR